MVAAFEALMAMSATNTRKVENDFQTLLAEKQRQEKLKRKAQEEKEKRERELQAKLRLKHMEEEKRNQERLKRQEEERAAKQREMERREAEMRDSLRFGPKGSKTQYPSSSSAGGSRRRTSPSDDGDGPGGSALTREEKRRKRLENEMRFGLKTSRRSTHTSGYQRMGKRLPGGAVDVVATANNSDSANATQYRSVKERLAAQMPTLTPLNQEKRDTRTIDEFTRDLKAKKEGRVLEGDAAKEFLAHGFFSTKTKPELKSSQASSMFGSRASSMENDSTTAATRPGVKSTPSKSATPPVQSKLVPSAKSSVPATKPAMPSFTKTSALSVKAIGKLPAPSSSAPAKTPSKQPLSKATPSSSKVSTTPRPVPKPSLSSSALSKKRPRSPSLSPSPPPSKRRPSGPKDDLSSQIWALFGRDRDRYVNQDVLSDDEDMEADASALEREELRSARLARREDEEALEEERRREEEKRRRKKEKEARERRL
ncbi:unnamed protein product [Somion occarium]|uniref:Uncharacterized protein n=1 Tax=Somion occarium TaxID=3059160 RepID=A0ABP1E8T0_9APHY